jgi:hypothetical protein
VILPNPAKMGSYHPDDVVFLLKDLGDFQLEQTTEDREEAIQTGVHYSEMLPMEYKPSAQYIEMFHKTLNESAEKVALSVATVAELIWKKRGENLCLVSLARAGTPIGILIKRYIQERYLKQIPHFSISIIRGKGIDENAIHYILKNQPRDTFIQFVDGWTGKGAIRMQLIEACRTFREKYDVELSDDLAVLADPGHCSLTYGTREDFLIPSSCLNSTVSGLVSRTVHRVDLTGVHEFHGAKFYKEWINEDLSVYFLEKISEHYSNVSEEARQRANELYEGKPVATWHGLKDIQTIQNVFNIQDINLIKPGVGETTRVLLRRKPWKILVDKLDNPNLKHIIMLAKDRGVPVEVFAEMTYSCCGLIQPLFAEEVIG